MSAISLPVKGLQKGKLLICIKENKTYKIHDIDAVSIKLISVEGHTIRYIPLTMLLPDEWILQE